MKTTTNPHIILCRRAKALAWATARAGAAGLDDIAADAAAHRAMDVWDADLTLREWQEFVDVEVQRHAHP